ncbi:cupin domain-containing protein [Deinococcus psychrotolerans]|uniref:Cupin domain-containing protein n=1 Tax=Deinococcus psychrotolerans TaxID=2489213 RepID=A0A3G8YDF4_9DEIO|nr:cupin domain-containing protein [Deinococcus psychrotolerans]AZI43015.1 cupin domain-containing protein [Deinococcus psychrotolerans]
MKHTPSSELPARPAPEDRFTGPVWMQPLTSEVMRVTFTPGARTAWHTHPHGQTLLIVSGSGRAQKRGGPVVSFQAGDIVTVEAGEEHWHGAAPDSVMSHFALQAGQTVWLDKVTDEDYAS